MAEVTVLSPNDGPNGMDSYKNIGKKMDHVFPGIPPAGHESRWDGSSSFLMTKGGDRDGKVVCAVRALFTR